MVSKGDIFFGFISLSFVCWSWTSTEAIRPYPRPSIVLAVHFLLLISSGFHLRLPLFALSTSAVVPE